MFDYSSPLCSRQPHSVVRCDACWIYCFCNPLDMSGRIFDLSIWSSAYIYTFGCAYTSRSAQIWIWGIYWKNPHPSPIRFWNWGTAGCCVVLNELASGTEELVLIDQMSNIIIMDLCSVWLASGWLSYMARNWMLSIRHTIFNQIFHICHALLIHIQGRQRSVIWIWVGVLTDKFFSNLA